MSNIVLHIVFGFDFLELLTRQWRAQGLLEKISLHGLKLFEFWPSFGEMARPNGNPKCTCGKKLGVHSPELQEDWATERGCKWGTRPGGSRA